MINTADLKAQDGKIKVSDKTESSLASTRQSKTLGCSRSLTKLGGMMFKEQEFTEEQLVGQFEDRMKGFDIPKYVREGVLQRVNSAGETVPSLKEEDLEHVEYCLKVLINFYRGEDPGGHFISAVVRNDLLDAVAHADGANSKALRMYALFIYNHIPLQLVKLRKEELEEARSKR
jgi:hypothetical protein